MNLPYQSDLSFSTLWFYAIPTIFFISLCLMIPQIRLTFRNPSTRKRQFWNFIEIVWLVFAIFGLVGVASSSWPGARQYFVTSIEGASSEALSRSVQSANRLIADHCDQDTGTDICDALMAIRNLEDTDDPAFIDDAFRNYMRKIQSMPVDSPVQLLDADVVIGLSMARTLYADIQYERSVQSGFPVFTSYIFMVWPHLFAMALGIRMARAIAMFAFK
ncbi:hypothetical protein [Jiella pelagia]|uniref:DUF4239 domain-containing protein n=1 Tax=Jiella pelagia TaxID=2986949 RepID=A0ABY7BXT7_9HYPH|nr:hypothetical protein [Jiella pelagia]WAP68228.1 hypothetical protein OH818_23155 [Jiella pelagia]